MPQNKTGPLRRTGWQKGSGAWENAVCKLFLENVPPGAPPARLACLALSARPAFVAAVVHGGLRGRADSCLRPLSRAARAAPSSRCLAKPP